MLILPEAAPDKRLFRLQLIVGFCAVLGLATAAFGWLVQQDVRLLTHLVPRVEPSLPRGIAAHGVGVVPAPAQLEGLVNALHEVASEHQLSLRDYALEPHTTQIPTAVAAVPAQPQLVLMRGSLRLHGGYVGLKAFLAGMAGRYPGWTLTQLEFSRGEALGGDGTPVLDMRIAFAMLSLPAVQAVSVQAATTHEFQR